MNLLCHALVRPLGVLLAVLAGPPSWPVAVAQEGAAAASAAKPKPKLTQGQPAKRAPVAKTQPKPLSAASAEQIEAAERVYYGAHQCASGPAIDVSLHPVHAGYVGVRAGKASYVMKPVLSATGALRLEDVKGVQHRMQRFIGRRGHLDKQGLAFGAAPVHAVQHQAVQVDVQVGGRPDRESSAGST